MKTLGYLNSILESYSTKLESLECLKEVLGIKFSINEKYPELVILNYDQINSPKFHPIVKECRSLVLGMDKEEFYVVSRSMERFFNVNEDPSQEVDINSLRAVEKVDGSLVSLFYFKGEWLYRTRSMLMPEGMINDTSVTWKELIEETIFNRGMQDFNLYTSHTYVFEVVSPENRVVTRYTDWDAYLLVEVDNDSGEYYSSDMDVYKYFGWKEPKEYHFDSEEHIKEIVEDLPDLKEGVVLYDEDNTPVLKLKSSAYLVCHRLRGETTPTKKRIMDLIFMNEQGEYLAIFPEDTRRFYPWMKAYSELQADYLYMKNQYMYIEDQKEFALAIKDSPVKDLLFYVRGRENLTLQDCFDRLFTTKKYKLVEEYCEHKD